MIHSMMLLLTVVLNADQTAELKALGGCWIVNEGEWNGVTIPAKELADIRVDFSIDRIFQANRVGSSNWSYGRFEVDPSSTPKRFHVALEFDDQFAGKGFHGIYELDGGQLKVCLVPDHLERPADFAVSANGRPMFRGTFIPQSREQANRDRITVAEANLLSASNNSDTARASLLLAEALFAADQQAEAQREVQRTLKFAALESGTNDLIRGAYLLNARIALKSGDAAKAKDELVKLVTIPAFEPIRMEIAETLLVEGQKGLVIDFLKACRDEAEISAAQFDEWSKEIEKGSVPDFSSRVKQPASPMENVLAAMDGNWRFISGIRNGQPVAIKPFFAELASRGGIGRFRRQKGYGVDLSGRFTIDVAATPRSIDFTITEGVIQGAVFSGIYKIENDELTICAAPPGQERPRVFVSAPQSDRLLFVFDRVAGAGNRTLNAEQEARQAIKELQRATDLEQRFGRLMDAAKLCMNAGKTQEGSQFAAELLKLATTRFQQAQNVGEALHDAHLVLGRVAATKGRLDDAKRHLLAMAPHVNTRGIGGVEYPDMTLAKELLERGEIATFLEFLSLLRQQPTSQTMLPKLDRWTQDAQAGRMPDFQFHVVTEFEEN